MSFRVIDPDAVPDKFCEITVTMPVELWLALCRRSDFKWSEFAPPGSVIESPRTPSLSLIEAALAKPCGNPRCRNGQVATERSVRLCIADGSPMESEACPECGGSGHPRIAGVEVEAQ